MRVDAGIAVGDAVTGRFDPMLAKLIAHGADRREALSRLTAALDETVVLGVTTNLRFLRWLIGRPEVIHGQARVDTLDAIWPPADDTNRTTPSVIPDAVWAEAARLLDAGGWRLNGPARTRLVSEDGTERSVAASEDPAGPTLASIRAGETAHVDVDGRSVSFRVAPPPDVDRAARAAAAHAHGGGPTDVVAPMPGAVLVVHVSIGDVVASGDPIVTLEAMKMEHIVVAPRPGRVADITVRAGEQVTRGVALATIDE
jgi:acetyl-CoA/propionyl-CoA carboxylase, biotin carboxylase, biotin carboxyl carrier protein